MLGGKRHEDFPERLVDGGEGVGSAAIEIGGRPDRELRAEDLGKAGGDVIDRGVLKIDGDRRGVDGEVLGDGRDAGFEARLNFRVGGGGGGFLQELEVAPGGLIELFLSGLALGEIGAAEALEERGPAGGVGLGSRRRGRGGGGLRGGGSAEGEQQGGGDKAVTKHDGTPSDPI
jgi:hypothetical protein